MDQIFLLLLLLAIIAGLYWYHLKIENEMISHQNINVTKKSKSHERNTTSDEEMSFDDISIGTLSMDSFNSSVSGGSSRLSYESNEEDEDSNNGDDDSASKSMSSDGSGLSMESNDSNN